MAVKNGQLGYNESTFMPIFYGYTLGFSVCEKCTISYLKFKVVNSI